MLTWTVYLENQFGDVLSQTEVEAATQKEAELLGDEVFRESEWSAGYPTGYSVVAYAEG